MILFNCIIVCLERRYVFVLLSRNRNYISHVLFYCALNVLSSVRVPNYTLHIHSTWQRMRNYRRLYCQLINARSHIQIRMRVWHIRYVSCVNMNSIIVHMCSIYLPVQIRSTRAPTHRRPNGEDVILQSQFQDHSVYDQTISVLAPLFQHYRTSFI